MTERSTSRGTNYGHAGPGYDAHPWGVGKGERKRDRGAAAVARRSAKRRFRRSGAGLVGVSFKQWLAKREER